MTRFRGISGVARQVGLALLASVVIFIVTRALPRTPMQVYLETHGQPVTPEALEALSRRWGLDGPLTGQYLRWITGFLTGDWGESISSGTQVSAEFLSRLPASLAIGLGGVTLAFILSYPLGMLAYTRGGLWDGLTRVLAIAGQAVPSFLVCTLIIAVLGVKLRWIPFYRLPPERAVVAPMLVVGLYSLGQLSRIAYAHAEQQAAEPYVMAAVSRGFTRSQVLWCDAWRPVVYGLVSAVIAKMAWVIGGTAVVEYVFAVPGISTYLISSISSRDYTVVQSYLMVLVLWMFATRVVLGLVLNRLDPRSR